MVLQDSYGRQFSYLRLSITDACNFRCVYCLPNGYRKTTSEQPLTVNEIENLCSALSEMGMWKVRLTGGEPTLRHDLIEITQCLSQIPGIRKIALSTNGYRLEQLARSLKEAGVSRINVSIDSLDRQRFKEITGRDFLVQILGGIEKSLELGISEIKVNAVLLMGSAEKQDEWIQKELSLFLDWIRKSPITVRLIELMPTGKNSEIFKKHHRSSHGIREWLLEAGWIPQSRSEGNGPAVEFEHPHYQGKIGIIAPYSKDFCASCNRLRVTSTGGLRLCLFGEGNYPLRPLLQERAQKEELKALFRTVLQQKERSHYLPEGRYGNNQTFSAMGG